MTAAGQPRGRVVLQAALLEARQRSGLSQAELAGRLGVPQPTIFRIENGQRRVEVVEFVVLARALGLDPIELLRDVVRATPSDQDF